MFISNQKGIAPLILLAVIGIIFFLVLSFTAPFQDGLIAQLFVRKDSSAATLLASCWPDAVPAGAIAGQPKPIWCYTDYTTNVPDTHVSAGNSWLDEFNHGVSFGEFKNGQGGYRVFDINTPGNGAVYHTQHWRHANHWMVDIADQDQTPSDFNPSGIGVPTCGLTDHLDLKILVMVKVKS